MLNTFYARRGMVSSPHHLASQAGLAVLREGGNAVEAAVATAAALAVVYPHMNGLGGDGFWLIHEPGKHPVCVDACGAAAAAATPMAYRDCAAVPAVGPRAAATVAGVVSGWQAALELSLRWGGRLPLARLFEEAVYHARHGVAATAHQARALARRESAGVDCGFAADWAAPGPVAPGEGVQALPALAVSFERLAAAGLDDFYRGGLGAEIGAGLQRAGAPVTAEDLARHRSVRRRPLSLALSCGTVYNLPPPSQGLASLMILGLYDRLDVPPGEGAAHVHAIVEATKLAFAVRDRHLADPAQMTVHPTTYLSQSVLDQMAGQIVTRRAAPWPRAAAGGDTVWFGVADGAGRVVSVIQSLCHAFGAGLWLADTGILWHNRATGFSLDPARHNTLLPGRKPLHTLNPALARLHDGRVVAYGCMGGDGQPQTQAAVFSRYALFGQGLQAAVTAPRWLLGGGRGGPPGDLVMETRFDARIVDSLRAWGHRVTLTTAFDDLVGHAGAVARHDDGWLEGAADPRSDGAVAAY